MKNPRKCLNLKQPPGHQYLTLPIVNGYVLPVVMKSLFHVTGSVPMDVWHLPLLARLSGTLSPRTCGIRRFLRTVTAVERIRVFLTRMCYTNHLTWHLTFGSRVGFRSRRYFRFDQIQDGGRPLPLTRPLLNKDEILKKIMVYRDSVSLDSHTDILMCCELLWKPTPYVSYASPLK